MLRGATLLQWQPELSAAGPWLALAVGAIGAAATLQGIVRDCAGPGFRCRLTRATGCGIALLVGIIDELLHASARGTRFAFAVETIETEHAVVPAQLSLAWYAQANKDGRHPAGMLGPGSEQQASSIRRMVRAGASFYSDLARAPHVCQRCPPAALLPDA